MSEIKYTESHEWVRVDAGVARVGITEYAQEQLGDIVFVELPSLEQQISKGDEVVTIESVKAAGEIHTPLSGVVKEINEALLETPELANQDPTGAGWFYALQLEDEAELEALMDQAAYDADIEDL